LFWKRKQTDSEIFSLKLNDRRASYRVSPSKSAPIVFDIKGHKARVVNISAGGLAFKCKHFTDGDSLAIEFLLPYLDVSIAPILEIKKIDKQNICHCNFKEIAEEEVEAIHQYVLERQKELMQSKKADMHKESLKTQILEIPDPSSG
jgi:c-di-GMP-binding flagellar brake protein YcgR